MANSTTQNRRSQGETEPRPAPRQSPNPFDHQYRALLESLLAPASEQTLKVVGLTSANRHEGVTSVACNLAVYAALQHLNILLIDANTGNPALQRIFQIPQNPGLTDLLYGDCLPDECVHDMSTRSFKTLPTALKNSIKQSIGRDKSMRVRDFAGLSLTIMSSGTKPAGRNDFNFLDDGDDRFLRNIRDEFDLLIVDLPAIPQLNQCSFAIDSLDGVIFVLEAEATTSLAAQKSLQQLRQTRANVLGVAFNKCRSHLPRWIDKKLGD